MLPNVQYQRVSLANQGFRFASSGLVYESRRILRGVAARDPTDSRVWEVLGLCSFSAGDVGDARDCLEKAASGNPESLAAIWSRELASGSIASALNDYRTALKQAGSGDYEAAYASLEPVRKMIPDFTPASRLEGLILAAQGNTPLARDVWQTQLQSVKDDPELHRLLAETADPDPIAPRSRARVRGMGLPRANVWAATCLAAAIALVAVDLSIRRLGSTATTDTSAPAGAESPAALPSAQRPTPGPSHSLPPAATTSIASAADRRNTGWTLFVDGRRDAQSGALQPAITKLTQAVSLGGGSFYQDDALYSLARAQAKAGDSRAASTTAAKLLREYPKSIFANSTIKRLAQMPRGALP